MTVCNLRHVSIFSDVARQRRRGARPADTARDRLMAARSGLTARRKRRPRTVQRCTALVRAAAAGRIAVLPALIVTRLPAAFLISPLPLPYVGLHLAH
ncbi:hypothetical protein [Pantoea sp. 1.19]|uniref:hypothetical protein n=1 Tax=Pantoea sp. 1.19 TaxID=1925589 RepID=UPI00094894DE|nr:hypothetical protein [Pantoea sp. 1.19]